MCFHSVAIPLSFYNVVVAKITRMKAMTVILMMIILIILTNFGIRPAITKGKRQVIYNIWLVLYFIDAKRMKGKVGLW